MNSNRYLIVLAFFSAVLLGSCTMQKRVHNPGFHIDWVKTNRDNKEVLTSDAQQALQTTDTEIEEGQIDTLTQPLEEPSTALTETIYMPDDEASEANSGDLQEPMITPTINWFEEDYNPEDCDNIILTDGEEISAKVLEISDEFVKYVKCDNQTGPVYITVKSKVFMIQYANGSKETITTVDAKTKGKNGDGEKEKGISPALGIVSLISSIIGLIILPILLGFIGIAFGIFGSSGKRKLKGLAIAGLILGIIDVVAGIIILAALV